MNNNTGQQKIYVDLEEEITTVIEQMRHVRVGDIVLVVPQHALLLQSVVNLKLLAQEAHKLKKNITIMTKDVDGAAFAQRAGIPVQPYVTEEEPYQSQHTSAKSTTDTVQQSTAQVAHEVRQARVQKRKSGRVHTVQSTVDTSQCTTNVPDVRAPRKVTHVEGIVQKKAPSREAHVQHSGSTQRQLSAPQNTHRTHTQEHQADNALAQYEKSLEEMHVQSTEKPFYQPQQRQVGTTAHPSQKKELSIKQRTYEKVPQHRVPASRAQHTKKKIKRKQKREAHVPGSAHFMLKGFICAGVTLIVMIVCVVVFPKTEITITPKDWHIDEYLDLTARTNQSVYDEDRRLIPARFVERDITFTKTFPATGRGDVTAQKAQGTIVIYNEYSEKPQPLVATTRFVSEDGVLFRLAKQTVVPGMKNGEAGKVEALVVADKNGAGGNIGPSRFTIPGFNGSPKKEKFYGVSEKSMVGGGAGGDGVALVTQADIDRAEAEMKTEVQSYIEEQLRAVLRPDSEVLLTAAMKSDTVRSEASVAPGTMGDDFMYEMTAHVAAVVFTQGDALAVMQSHLDGKVGQYDVTQLEVALDYDVADVNFDDQYIKMTVQGTADIASVVDVASFKADIAGKKHDALYGVIENTHGDTIEKISIDRVLPGFPSFIANKISRLESMTRVRVADEGSSE